MDRNEAGDTQRHKGHPGMRTPPIVSPGAWEAARQQMLVKEKSLMRARDALAPPAKSFRPPLAAPTGRGNGA